MKNIGKNLLEMLLLRHKYEIVTTLSPKQVMERVAGFVTAHCDEDYYGWVDEEKARFAIKEPYMKSHTFGTMRNSFAPVAIGSVAEENGKTKVSVCIRPRLDVLIVMIPVSLACLITVMYYPFVLLLEYLGLFRPAKRMKEAMELIFMDRSA